jgi:guanylate kinase
VASGNFFAEHAKVHNNYYGVSFAAWEKARLDQKIPILEIDIEGAKTILAKEKELNIAPRYLFIAPPSIEMLEARLTRRGTESSEDIELRLRNAQIEIDEATKSTFFDFILVNNEYQLSVNKFFRLVRDWSDFPFPRLTYLQLLLIQHPLFE